MTRKKPVHALIVPLVAALAMLALSACGPTVPITPAAPPTAQPAATQPPVKETVVVKETTVVKETVIVKETVVTQPTATPTATPTAPPTAAPTATKSSASVPVATKPPAQGGKLDFTTDDIEYAPTTRKGDNKIQLTITLKPRGGVAPFKFNLDGVTDVQGLTFTFDWHNCGQNEPHKIALYSADGQTIKDVGFIYPYKCD